MLAAISLIRQWWPVLGMAAAFAAGWTVQGWRHEAKDAELLKAQAEARQLKEERDAALAAKAEVIDTGFRNINRTLARRLDREVTKDPYLAPLLADGLRALSDAVSADPTGQPDGPTP
jgi:hypothetical protein